MKFVLVHGSFGSSAENWFPWLRDELEKLGHEVIAPDFPVEDYDNFVAQGEGTKATNQSFDNWLKVFSHEALPFIDSEEVIYVGHSLGSIFILQALVRFDLRAKYLFATAPFHQTLGDHWQFIEVNRTFCDDNYDFEPARNRIGKSFVFYSDNDPYVPIKYSEEFADKLGAERVLIHGKGHLNAESGMTELPELLSKMKQLS